MSRVVKGMFSAVIIVILCFVEHLSPQKQKQRSIVSMMERSNDNAGSAEVCYVVGN